MSLDERRTVAEQLRAAVGRLARRLRVERPAEALSGNKVAVLGHLHRRGPSSPGEVADAERQQPQSLTRVFAELEAARLVRRAPNAADRRGAVLTLTADGEAALRRDMAYRDAWLTRALADLGEVEVEVLRIAAGILDRLASAEPG